MQEPWGRGREQPGSWLSEALGAQPLPSKATPLCFTPVYLEGGPPPQWAWRAEHLAKEDLLRPLSLLSSLLFLHFGIGMSTLCLS